MYINKCAITPLRYYIITPLHHTPLRHCAITRDLSHLRDPFPLRRVFFSTCFSEPPQGTPHYQFEQIVFTVFNDTPGRSCSQNSFLEFVSSLVGHAVLGYYLFVEEMTIIRATRNPAGSECRLRSTTHN
jgi:hypothetical protein